MLEDDNGTAPAGSAESEPAPIPASSASPSPEPIEAETEGEATEAEAVEEIEFDFGGDKFRVPKGALPDDIAEQLDKRLKGTWSDYTRSKQEIAEAKKALETDRSVVQRISSLREDQLRTYAQGVHLAAEIEQLTQVDLTALWQSDPDRARRVSDTLAQKQAEYRRIETAIAQVGSSINAEEQQRTERAMEEGRRKVQSRIKGFDEAKIIDYAVKTYGFTEAEAKQWPLNPAGAEMAWKAMQWDAMQSQAAKPAAKPAAPPPAPVAPIKARSAPSDTDWLRSEKISGDEWARRRNQQLARERAQGRR